MKRLWVENAIFDNPAALATWLSDQDLSRFWFVAGRDEERVLLDVHEQPSEPVTGGFPAVVSSKQCEDLDCTLCTSSFRRIEASGPYYDEPVRSEPSAVSGAYPVAREWSKPLRQADDTDPIPKVRKSFPWALMLTWVFSLLLALMAAFICVRLWYVKYGCPFYPDNGLLSACKALSIRVSK